MNGREFATKNANRRAKVIGSGRLCRIVGYRNDMIIIELDATKSDYNGWSPEERIRNGEKIKWVVDDEPKLGYYTLMDDLELLNEYKTNKAFKIYTKTCKYCKAPARFNKHFMLCSKLCPKSRAIYLSPLAKTIKIETNGFIICPQCSNIANEVRRFYRSEIVRNLLNVGSVPLESKQYVRLMYCNNKHRWLHIVKPNERLKKDDGNVYIWNGASWKIDSTTR